MSDRGHICKSFYFLQKALMYFYDRLRSLSQEQNFVEAVSFSSINSLLNTQI